MFTAHPHEESEDSAENKGFKDSNYQTSLGLLITQGSQGALATKIKGERF